ncbi:cytidylate kinase [Oceanobacillus oncorhynchi subsp. incaldanensis]|uniref:Cytidylate kinase n=2 Tax=Oceanobacillus TaxID=182709 RepID=A0A0A1MYC5_9BACI|nr:(d)CMP kinase [Oceanobacillus oncorhynchi]MDM8101617.1 (d)CMP kinase [Oceanobacillus oncorhynchi]UUI38110.1 (d)CMP kinase [Oceanobacillus oncorhynchi]GIO17185.1 cytidylate kinase [Oceanobacillus oncorhynchi subsp. incaldanensis]CEI83766.1 Cytidylate kinase [Oceanobacillus oncorhynchi]
MELISIAIDGPAAAGKSTVAKQIAKKLGIIYVDTGAMYRALTYQTLQENIDLEDEKAVMEILNKIDIRLAQDKEGQRVFINEKDVTEAVRYPDVTASVSVIAKHPLVRKKMVAAQQELAQDNSVVMDGRDIGSHVLPDADVKIFLIASVTERAKRRFEENRQKGIPADLHTLEKEIEKRDELDSTREASPLVKAEDAVELDTTSLSIDDVTNKILEICQPFIEKLGIR